MHFCRVESKDIQEIQTQNQNDEYIYVMFLCHFVAWNQKIYRRFKLRIRMVRIHIPAQKDDLLTVKF
jgi:hypothetical protein